MNEVENILRSFVEYKKKVDALMQGESNEDESAIRYFDEMESSLCRAESELDEQEWSLDVENARCIIERFYKQLHTLRQRYTGGWDWTR